MILDLIDTLTEDQKELDQIIISKKGLNPKANLDDKAVAILVETGEFANEWRGFKFWSEKQEPKDREKLIKESVDCLHFFISILNDMDLTDNDNPEVSGYEYLLEIYQCIHQPSLQAPKELFKSLYKELSLFATNKSELRLIRALDVFDNLLRSLNISQEEVTEFYQGKNQENRERQDNGY